MGLSDCFFSIFRPPDYTNEDYMRGYYDGFDYFKSQIMDIIKRNDFKDKDKIIDDINYISKVYVNQNKPEGG